jgi:D-glycero-alpha-D-manno-heptose 1-phosphate guanylyltransferase
MIKECIILAGGLGTRLRSAVPDLPKCMAPVAGKPFLHYVIKHFLSQGIETFIFSLGYKHEVILDYLHKNLPAGQIKYYVEDEPMGTGGAIKFGCELAEQQNVLVANGDTLFRIDAGKLAAFHLREKANCTVCLKPMQDFDRYGVVELNKETNTISNFREKQFYREGLINGGIYALDVNDFLGKDWPDKFSFEKDYLESLYSFIPIHAQVQDEYFIDIGIPQDYVRAQVDFEKMKI